MGVMQEVTNSPNDCSSEYSELTSMTIAATRRTKTTRLTSVRLMLRKSNPAALRNLMASPIDEDPDLHLSKMPLRNLINCDNATVATMMTVPIPIA